MGKRLPILSLFILLAICPYLFAASSTNYEQIGTDAGSTYQQGDSDFNTQASSSTYAVSHNRQIGVPLVADMDGNGTNEIIINNDGTLNIYNVDFDKTNPLRLVDGFILHSSGNFSNAQVFDIDGDGYKEYIVAEENKDIIEIIEYNGTAVKYNEPVGLINVTTLFTKTNTNYVIKCGATDKCLIVGAGAANGAVDGAYIAASAFNSTAASTNITLDEVVDNNFIFCLPMLRTMAYGDYDNDGTDEFVVSATRTSATDNERVALYYVGTDNNVPTEELSRVKSVGSVFSSIGGLCDGNLNIPQIITSPLLADLDGQQSTGLEVAVGAMFDEDEFRIYTFESDASDLNQHPQAARADGIIVSNVILMNAFGTTEGAVDYCVLGYNGADETNPATNSPTDEQIDLICGSEQTGFLGLETREYYFPISDHFNITRERAHYNPLIHSMQSEGSLTDDGEDLNELVSAYGVHRLAFDGCSVFGECLLQMIFKNPIGDSVVVPVDVDKTSANDLLALTDTNLWYVDDQFVNTPPTIPNPPFTNPCLDSPWKINTSLVIRTTPTDINDDDISTRVILYQGHANEQKTEWKNGTSGTSQTFGTLNPNVTIDGGLLTIEALDIGSDPSGENTTLTLFFDVTENGVEFDDCTTEEQTAAEAAAEDLNLTSTDLQNNAITTGLRETGALVGMSEGIMVLFFFLIMNLAIWFHGGHNVSTTLGAMAIINIIAFIVAVKLQLISTGIIVLVSIVAIAGIGLWLARAFTGAGSSNG